MSRQFLYAFIGGVFGFLFCAAALNQYDVIHRMLLLQDLDPFLVMGSSMLTALPLLWLLERRRWVTPLGGVLNLRRWRPESKHVWGGVVFGTGWALTGACPGTISGMISAGNLLGFIPLLGFLTGMLLRDMVVEGRSGVADTAEAASG